MNKAILFALTAIASTVAFAQEAATEVIETSTKVSITNGSGLIAIAAAIAIGLAVFGGTSAQGKAAAAALEGMARNPAAGDKMFTPLILALALIESLVILAFLVAFVKLPAATFGF